MSDETNNPPGESTETPEENEQAQSQPARAPRKRILTKDLSARIADLERSVAALSQRLDKLEAPAGGTQSAGSGDRVAGLADQIAKLDERVNKLALVVAQGPLRV